MKISLKVILVMFAAVLVVIWPSSQVTEAKAKPGPVDSFTFPLQGYHADKMCGFLSYTGSFTLQRFESQSGGLVAEGLASGKISNNCGQVIYTFSNQPQALPISSTSGTCDSLSFTTVQTTLQAYAAQPVILPSQKFDITPNLSGNKLCKVDKVISKESPDKLAARLNKILGL